MHLARSGGKAANTLPATAILLVVLVMLTGAWDGAWAAPRDGPVEPVWEERDSISPNQVLRAIQSALHEMGLYNGPLDGRDTDSLRAAIRAYQRQTGRRVTGEPSPALAEHLETQGRVGVMLRKLDEQRRSSQEAARQALLKSVRTRRLLDSERVETVADPTRDPAPCFREPNQACLLEEALESAKAIHKREMRDWALGEILVAQTRAGFLDDAIDTVARIGDARLIIVALRDIARAQAQAGRINDAFAAVEIIPDNYKRLEALAAIADIQLNQADEDGAQETASRIVALARKLPNTLQQVTLLAQMAVVLNRVGDVAGATQAIDEAHELARSPALAAQIRRTEKGAALRHIAAAFAEIGQPTRALAVISEVTGTYDRTAVLMSAATAQARSGDVTGALETAARIESDRYRPVVLGRIAKVQAAAGDHDAAAETIDAALEAAASIELSYARSYAVGQLVLSLIDIGIASDGEVLAQAVETARRIENERIRAYVLWTAATAMEDAGRAEQAVRAQGLAVSATEAIGSSLSRAWMLGDIASDNALAGNAVRAEEAFRRGIGVAENIHNAWGRARVLAKLAVTLSDLR